MAVINFSKYNVIPDPSLTGKPFGEMREGEKDVRVSPAIYDLLQDPIERDKILNDLNVEIIPLAPPRPRRKKPAKE